MIKALMPGSRMEACRMALETKDPIVMANAISNADYLSLEDKTEAMKTFKQTLAKHSGFRLITGLTLGVTFQGADS